jgi:hypothetical protein
MDIELSDTDKKACEGIVMYASNHDNSEMPDSKAMQTSMSYPRAAKTLKSIEPKNKRAINDRNQE